VLVTSSPRSWRRRTPPRKGPNAYPTPPPRHPALAAREPRQLAAMHRGTCVPSTELPLTSDRMLGEFFTRDRCEVIRAATQQAWTQLEREADGDVPPPQDQALRMVTTFSCAPSPEAPPSDADR
jgi:hypothetical protein